MSMQTLNWFRRPLTSKILAKSNRPKLARKCNETRKETKANSHRSPDDGDGGVAWSARPARMPLGKLHRLTAGEAPVLSLINNK